MKRLLALLGLVMSVPVQAQDFALRGQWEVRAPAIPAYKAAILVDAEARMTFDSPNDYGRPARFFGYVERIDKRQVQIIATNRAEVSKALCIVETNELLHCYAVRDDKSVSVGFMLLKIGPGPVKLAQPSL